ncbi:hypothetical protein LWI28_027769 [Acer negundo]|uniref:Uncharacterized protein n=1 Tax=Acer negundo TaxID=4023 RepID=A0AAD5IP64_ACENE|nr:hypothetical protein LWI28_027769 [Acer negundo]KAK4842765.1 hypothetical protein QYF36_027330 [Acer negundo]
MGSMFNSSKRRYDISMSKRTRKPLNVEDSDGNRTMEMGSPRRESPDDLKGAVDAEEQEEEEEGNDVKGVIDIVEDDQLKEENDRMSLKQLIKGDEKSKVKINRGRNSLGEHFTEEEKQLQLVKAQKQKGVKFKGMVNHYVKVVGHLIKLKRDPRNSNIASRKNPLLRLTI